MVVAPPPLAPDAALPEPPPAQVVERPVKPPVVVKKPVVRPAHPAAKGSAAAPEDLTKSQY